MADRLGLIVFVLLCVVPFSYSITLDERPAGPGEWGFRPAKNESISANPPSFVWRYQKGLTWQVECALMEAGKNFTYSVSDLELNVHCPPTTFPAGSYQWRYRGKDSQGNWTGWSVVRPFTIAADAISMPMPEKAELLSRIPDSHPRLFVRPEKMSHLRTLAREELKDKYEAMVRECERILKNPPDTTEPPKYPAGMERGSDPWREIWWGNRTYTIRALNSAALLAFTRLLGGPEKYGQEAKRILMECARWDPVGSTGYRYNDEAGMPYNYYFSRTYTFVNDLLSEQEKQACRQIMQIRGKEMYEHLWPRHLWQPYASHSNRAWHFLGEVAVAFHEEVEGAADWLWFAMNVFYNMYPVWCDDDGGWHEGASYWSSYQDRFAWWADVMREAMGIHAFDKPYYSQVGYYCMYLLPPNKVGAGFGDLCAPKRSSNFRGIMSVFAAQAQNPHWQWWVQQHGDPVEEGGYIGFIRGALPTVGAKAPDDLPASRLFHGIGQACLNTQIFDADDNVQIAFKSSPFGTQSHGYEANNSFLLWAYGKRLLIRSGYRDSYGSEHHSKWMWSTRSVNNITLDGMGQGRRTAGAQGQIIAFETTPEMDLVIGEAGRAYEKPLERFTRAILFIKPELMIVYDRLAAAQPSSFEYWLHALYKMQVRDQHDILVKNDDVFCRIDFLAPLDLTFEQTDQYDPNPRPRITLREWHLTGKTPDKQKQVEFVTLYRIGRQRQTLPHEATLKKEDGGYILNVAVSDGSVTALLPIRDDWDYAVGDLKTSGTVAIRRQYHDGRICRLLLK
ncbi:MAG: DUF4962 domain-containing protein [Sedimentisphaerales bacterium]|nr:DUF4962 domain-containing protein [Sedimentisphaerales bacterium]